ncbi:MAG: PepSY-like domain-containing protein [Bacteroidota bacterium]
MKKICLLVMAIIVFNVFNPVAAQLRKVPAEVTEAFKAKYPDTKNLEWKDKLTGFEADFEMNGIKYSARFSNKGEWQQTERDIAEDALPATVKDGYGKSKYTDWELKAVSRVESKEDGLQYRLLIRKSSVEKKYLYFNESGQLVKDTITI